MITEFRKKKLKALVDDNGEIRDLNVLITNGKMIKAYFENNRIFYQVQGNDLKESQMLLHREHINDIIEVLINLKADIEEHRKSIDIGEITIDDLFS